MPSVIDLLGGTAVTDVPFASGLAVHVTYDPTKITARLIDPSTTDPAEGARVACRIVAGWDLADGEGDIPVGPGSEDAVATRVPLGVLGTILAAIMQEQQPVPPSARS